MPPHAMLINGYNLSTVRHARTLPRVREKHKSNGGCHIRGNPKYQIVDKIQEKSITSSYSPLA